MSGRLVVLSLLISGLLLLGLGSFNGGVIALAIPLCIYLIAAVRWSPENPILSAIRELSADEVYPGTPVKVTLKIRNVGPDLDEVYLEDTIPPGLEVVEGDTSLFAPFPSGEELQLEYTVQVKRGDYKFTGFSITYREPFGIFVKRAEISHQESLVVQPRPTTMKTIPIRPPQTRGFAGPIPSRQGGVGDSFFSVRDYHPGDPQHRINWKIAARGSSELFTNVYEQERVADVGIILDARQQSFGDMENSPLFELTVQATASLAESYLNEGNRVGLLVYGGGIERAFPGVGKVQRHRILNVLARAKTARNYALETLHYLPTRFFPSRSQVILVSPLLPNDAEILINFRSRGYAVMVLSPDLNRFEAGKVEPDSRQDLALKISRAERMLLLQRIRRAGVQVIDWDVSVPLEQIVRQARSLRISMNHIVELHL